MAKKEVQCYENFPDMGESTHVVPKPSFNQVYGDEHAGFFTVTSNSDTVDLDNSRYKDFDFKFIKGKSEYTVNTVMGSFNRNNYIHNGLDKKSIGSSGHHFWDKDSGCMFSKNFSPEKKVGYIIGYNDYSNNGQKIGSNAWKDQKVLPVRGCVGWSGRIEITNEFSGKEDWRFVRFLGLYMIMCDKNQNVKLAELFGCTHEVAKDRTSDIKPADVAGLVGTGADKSTSLIDSNHRDPYCPEKDKGYLYRSQCSKNWSSACSDNSYKSPQNYFGNITYCFTRSTQKKIYQEKWVPVGMMFYVGFHGGGTKSTNCEIKLKRNKLLYNPQIYGPGEGVSAGYFGVKSGSTSKPNPQEYHDSLSGTAQKCRMILPELVSLKDYWSTIGNNKKKLMAVTY